jgi:hypothetical protein
MQCILHMIYFWKVFHMYYKLICILYALLCGQNSILVKSGCYKSTTSLSAEIGALASPLGHHPESDLATDLYSGSTPIVIMDGSDHRISFNSLKKFVTSLSVAIGALGSPLRPHPESGIAIDLYSSSTPIANMDESNHRISFNLNKSTISL